MFKRAQFLSRYLLGIATALSVGAAVAAPIDIYDLRGLVREAAQNHPSVLNARILIDAAENEVQYAEKQRLPELSLSTATQGAGSTGAVIVKQPLWAGGGLDAREGLSRSNLEVAQATADEQEVTIAARTLEAWRNFVLSQQKIIVVDDGMGQLQELIGMMERRVAANVSPKVELDLVNARLIQSQVERATLAAERDLAVRRLEELVGGGVQVNEPEPELLKRWIALMDGGWPRLSPTELSEIAAYQPTVRRVRLEAKSANAEVQQTEANQWPQVYLQFQQGINAPVTNDKRVVLGMEYTPGRGFSSRQQIDVALARARAKDITIQTAIRDARDSLNAKLQAIDRAQTLAKSWVPSVSASEALLASYQRQFIAGRKTWQDVLNQQRELTQGRQSLIDARITWVTSVAELELMRAARPQTRQPSDSWLSPFFADTKAAAGLPIDVGLSKGQDSEAVMGTPAGQSTSATTLSTLPSSRPVQLSKMNVDSVPKGSDNSVVMQAQSATLAISFDSLFDPSDPTATVLSERGRQRLDAWTSSVRNRYQRLNELAVGGLTDPKTNTSPAAAKISKARITAVFDYLRAKGIPVAVWRVRWLRTNSQGDLPCGSQISGIGGDCEHANQIVEIHLEGIPHGNTLSMALPPNHRGQS